VAGWEGSFRVELSEVGWLFRENKSGYYCTGDLPGSVAEAMIMLDPQVFSVVL
jgi:hypothetical protein